MCRWVNLGHVGWVPKLLSPPTLWNSRTSQKSTKKCHEYFECPLKQESQTSGLRAACGPPDAFVWPANIPQNDKMINFDQISLF